MVTSKTILFIPPAILILVAIITILLTFLFGFSKEVKLIPLEIPFTMRQELLASVTIDVWARAPVPIYVRYIAYNLTKIEDDGSITHRIDTFQLFPTGEVSHGAASAYYLLELIDPLLEPKVDTLMEKKPIIYIEDFPIGGFYNLIFLLTTLTFNNWTIINWSMIGLGLVGCGMGLLLLILNFKKSTPTIKIDPSNAQIASVTRAKN